MQQILIPIGIMVGLSILSWLVQQMKNAADKKQMQRDRERQRAAAAARAERQADNRDREFDRPVPPPPPPAIRAANSEVDRFMQEINKLRERTGAPPAARPGAPAASSRAIPTVVPVRKKKRVSEEAPSTFPVTTGQVATGQSLLPSNPTPPRDDLPMATIVGTAPRIVSVPPPATPTSPPVVTKAVKAKSVMVDRQAPPTTGAAVQLMALLKDKKSVAAAILLHEVLGPPKGKRSIG